MKIKLSRKMFWVTGGVVLATVITFLLSNYIDGKNTDVAIVETILPEIDEQYENGYALYQENCSGCHGESLGGRKGLGPPFVHGYYKPSHHANIAFYRAISGGVISHHWQFGNMPPVSSVTESEATEIIKLIRYVQRANGLG